MASAFNKKAVSLEAAFLIYLLIRMISSKETAFPFSPQRVRSLLLMSRSSDRLFALLCPETTFLLSATSSFVWPRTDASVGI